MSLLLTSSAPSAPDPLAGLADRLDPKPNPWATDPSGWVSDRLNGFLWSKQREIAASVVAHRRTAVRSSHGIGKSYTVAQLAAWWIDTHPPGSAIVVSTAPTYKQVHVVLWEEIRAAHRRSAQTDQTLPGRVTLDDEWKIGDILVGFGRKPADHDEHGFQGIHRRYVLVILDEACGIPTQLWTAAEAITTNADCRIVAIGNPDDPSSEFHKVCRPGSGWHVIGVSTFDTPAFTGEQVPADLLPLLPSKEWADDALKRWRQGSPLYQSKVLGQFPENATDTVVPLSWANACTDLDDPIPDDGSVALGVDVGAGGDETVVCLRRGARAEIIERNQSRDPMEVVGLVVAAINTTGATSVKVDVIGWGWGVWGRLVELGHEGTHGAIVHPVNVGEGSYDPVRFPKLRDQLWWEIGRELSEHQAWDLSGIDEDTLAQLTSPKYSLDSAGRVKVEPKDETRKRLGRSPDDADALLLAFYEPPSEPDDVVEYDDHVEISRY